jgi:cytoskeletal protein RodZ
MQTLGEYLKKGREARNFSLTDISDYTKISKLYLDSLENDDYTKMPAELYVKGYISSYALCVGIDEREALKLYDSFQVETKGAQEIQAGILQDPKDSTPFFPRLNKKIWFAAFFGILIILAIGSYYSFFRNQKTATANKSPEAQNKTMQPAQISAIESDPAPKRQAGNSIQPTIQDGLEKKVDRIAVGTKTDDNISHNSVATPLRLTEPQPPLPGNQPEQSLKSTVLEQPIFKYSTLNDVSVAADDQAHFENNIKVLEAVACTGIKNRIPQESGESFGWSVERIIIWTRLQCEKPPTSIRHIYYFKGEKANDILLSVRSSHWRTWSYKTISSKRYIGPWRVDITSADGKLLQSIHFEIR